jgi:hypothetical protein
MLNRTSLVEPLEEKCRTRSIYWELSKWADATDLERQARSIGHLRWPRVADPHRNLIGAAKTASLGSPRFAFEYFGL